MRHRTSAKVMGSCRPPAPPPGRPARVRAALAACAVAALVAAPASGEAIRVERVHDPVIVPGAKLDGLAARDTTRLRLRRVEAGRLVPMPYQFDPRDADGEVSVDGPEDFVLDANDELVFMLKDAGERATPELLPDDCEQALEIEVTVPGDGGRAWAYLLAFRDPPPDERFPPYVSFDVATQSARSAHYRVGYAPGRNFFTDVAVLPASHGDGANLLRQTRMRGSPTFGLLFAELTLDFTEQSSIVEIDGVRVGPVRAVRRAQLSVDLGALFPELPSGIAYTFHYATSYATPSRIGFPWIMLETLRDFRFENVLDFRPEAAPLRYFDAGRPEGVLLDPDAPGELRTTEDHEWWVHSGAGGTMLHALVIPEAWRSWGVVRGTVIRSVSAGDPDAAAAGGEPRVAAGYTLLNMTSLREAGEYDLLMSSVVLPRPYEPGDERAAMAMLREPLQVAVHELPLPAQREISAGADGRAARPTG